MSKPRVSSDIVKALFHFIGNKKRKFRFPADVKNLHVAFYKLFKMKQYSPLFEKFVFDTSKMFPYCPTVRSSLDRLQKTNLLACLNPELSVFEISDALSDYDIDRADLFTSDELVILKTAAREFETLIAAKR